MHKIHEGYTHNHQDTIVHELLFRGTGGFNSFVIHRVGSTEFSWLNAMETFCYKVRMSKENQTGKQSNFFVL